MRSLVVAATLAWIVGGGCAKPKSLEREWRQKTKQECAQLADLLMEQEQTMLRLVTAFRAELKKTGPKRTIYNPGMFSRLARKAEPLDLSLPRRKERLRRTAWMIHYRFVKNAGPLVSRLHLLVAMTRQLKASLELGQSFEQKFGKQLAARGAGWKPLSKRTRPQFGLVLKTPTGAAFSGALGEPIKQGPGHRCVTASPEAAQGYRLGDGKCFYFTTPPAKPGECPRSQGTLRVFDNKDPALGKALRCLSMADVLMETYRFRLLDLEITLSDLAMSAPSDLAQKLRAAGGTR